MQPGTTSAFKQPSDPNICSGTNYLQIWNVFKRTKSAFRASCDCWEMPEPWLTWELGYYYFFDQKLFTRTEWRNGWWKLVDINDMCCVHCIIHALSFYVCLSLVQRSEIKRGISPGNITMWLHTHTMKLEIACINDSSNENMHRPSHSHQSVFIFIYLFIFWLFEAPNLCTGNTHSWYDVSHRSRRLHLQSFQQASAKPKRNNFRKPTGVPTSFFCHCVSTNSSTYRPTQTCCFYNHPESTGRCRNQKILEQDIWRVKKSSFSR